MALKHLWILVRLISCWGGISLVGKSAVSVIGKTSKPIGFHWIMGYCIQMLSCLLVEMRYRSLCSQINQLQCCVTLLFFPHGGCQMIGCWLFSAGCCPRNQIGATWRAADQIAPGLELKVECRIHGIVWLLVDCTVGLSHFWASIALGTI